MKTRAGDPKALSAPSNSSWKVRALPKKRSPLMACTVATLCAAPPTASCPRTSCVRYDCLAILVDIFHEKLSDVKTVPASTATAKFFHTVTTETRPSTSKSTVSSAPTNRRLDQLKVEWQTASMTPAREAVGICRSRGAPRTRRPAMAQKHATLPTRALPPLSSITRLWPSEAAPPRPPTRLEATLARPWLSDSAVVDPRVPSSTTPSTTCSTRRDSRRPTAAIVAAYGSTPTAIRAQPPGPPPLGPRAARPSACRGRSRGRAPRPPARAHDGTQFAMSPRVEAGRRSALATRADAAMATKDAGALSERTGTSLTRPRLRAATPNEAASLGPCRRRPVAGSRKWRSCARKSTTARPLTKPSMTGCGIRRVYLPTRQRPARSCRRPAQSTAGGRAPGPWSLMSWAATTAVALEAPVTSPPREVVQADVPLITKVVHSPTSV
mmetsp:Transcript_4687/g.11018  ORF Transcript_4687/g.11018 Transcript_4687/m.11018 type:complete len:440 (-) Transcript_4687:511-1830(-)